MVFNYVRRFRKLARSRNEPNAANVVPEYVEKISITYLRRANPGFGNYLYELARMQSRWANYLYGRYFV